MHNTLPLQFARRANVTQTEIDAKLKWLTESLAAEEQSRRLFGTPLEEEQSRLMRRPLMTQEAYAKFGALLGALPPAAVFYRIFGYGMYRATFSEPDWWPFFFLLCFAMNFVCGMVGCKLGRIAGQHIDDLERVSWNRMLITTTLIGIFWGLAVGGTGGAVFFGVGAPFGIIFAVPIAALAFPVFTLLHRTLTRGGMIETAHFRPLAWGTTMTIAALVLSPYLFPH